MSGRFFCGYCGQDVEGYHEAPASVQAKYCKPLGRCHSTGAGESKHGGPYRFDTKTGYPLNGPPADQALVAVGKAAYVPEWAVSRASRPCWWPWTPSKTCLPPRGPARPTLSGLRSS
jgi:hypothetical protein